MSYKCKLCGRDKFDKPAPHICNGQFIKHFGRIAKNNQMESIWINLEDCSPMDTSHITVRY